MLYEIVNMRDPYTIEAMSLDVAAVACAILGGGQYQFRPLEDGGEEIPFFMFGGEDEWCQKHFRETFEQTASRVRKDKMEELADCLDSVLIGHAQDRKTYNNGLELIDDPEKREIWRCLWHDERRSSLNDIGGRAYKIAKNFRESINQFEKAPQQVFAL